jgi:hypothetical protein
MACEQSSMVSPDVASVGDVADALGGITAVLIAEPTIPIDIDVKPALREDPEDPPVGENTLSINKGGSVTVALLGSASFEVSWVDVSTVTFRAASPLHQFDTDPEVQAYLDHLRDVNEDGQEDLVLHFDARQALQDLELGLQLLCLTGLTDVEEPVDFGGCEEVKITGRNGKKGG